MSNDSSSSEEELDRFKEAVDENFLPKNLYENDNFQKKYEDSTKSCLLNHGQSTSNNPFSVKVTPEFQKYVSKHLSRLMDELIDDSHIVWKKRKSRRNLSLDAGVRLLHTSKNYVVLADNKETNVKQTVPKQKSSKDTIDFEERAKEVAVSPEWVLSKKETEHWAPFTKGEVEVIKISPPKKKFKTGNS